MPVAAVNGQQINYTDSGGDGPAIIWSHGFMMDHTMFDPQVAHFGSDYRCIAWDERGFGATPVTASFTYWDSADDAVALLDHLGIEQAVFAGMSQGGFLSMRAALRYPERARGLVLIDTQAGLEDPAVVEGYQGLMDAWMSDGPAEGIAEIIAGIILGTPELNAAWIPIWEERRSDFSEHVGTCLLERDDITDRISEIKAPALVVHGDADAAIPLELGQYLADTIDGAAIAVMAGGSHAANLTNPDETNAAIAGFLATL